MSPGAAVAAALVVTVGSIVQGSVGFGLGLLGAPLLLLIEPRLVPGPMLVTSLVLTLMLAHREHESIRWRDLGYSLPGRVAGTIAAALVLHALPAAHLELALGILVVVSVGLSASGMHLAPGPRTLFGAGTLAGFMGTTTSVGGPPMALVYQHQDGPSIRATLSAFFVAGVVISIVALAAVGRFGREELRLSLVLLPGVPLGYLLSHRTRRYLDAGWTRPAILAVSFAAGALVIVRSLP